MDIHIHLHIHFKHIVALATRKLIEKEKKCLLDNSNSFQMSPHSSHTDKIPPRYSGKTKHQEAYFDVIKKTIFDLSDHRISSAYFSEKRKKMPPR